TSSAKFSGDRLKHRIGIACSHDAEIVQRVTLTDLAAGCAVGRDAAGASSRHVAGGVPVSHAKCQALNPANCHDLRRGIG
ncbi:MAG: hypothetical protein NT069_31200, partial [Planctomycetota bacterium]|nr:hypothetical protein [Planctomycetota bacterium]